MLADLTIAMSELAVGPYLSAFRTSYIFQVLFSFLYLSLRTTLILYNLTKDGIHIEINTENLKSREINENYETVRNQAVFIRTFNIALNIFFLHTKPSKFLGYKNFGAFHVFSGLNRNCKYV